MKILTDTFSISSDLHNISDYAGFQFYGLTALPLTRINRSTSKLESLGAYSWSSNNDFTEWTFNLNYNFWSDGTPVTTDQYLQGFLTVFLNPKSRFRKTLSDIRGITDLQKGLGSIEQLGISIKGNQIFFSLTRSNVFLPELLSIACFSPLNNAKNCSAGPYKAIGNSKLILNPYFKFNALDKKIEEIDFLLSDSASDDSYGLKAFDKNELAITCNTYFPTQMILKYQERSDFHIEPSGLYCVLTLGDLYAEIPEYLRRILGTIICRESLSSFFHASFKPVSGYEGNKPKKAASMSAVTTKLTVAFENFYPNREILEHLKQQLLPFGVELQLICEPYGSRAAQTHYRFEIRQSPIIDPFLLYRAEAQNPRFKILSSYWTEYCQQLFLYQSSECTKFRRQCGSKLENILNDEGILIPILELPSIYLKKQGIDHGHFSVGHVWTKEN